MIKDVRMRASKKGRGLIDFSMLLNQKLKQTNKQITKQKQVPTLSIGFL